MRDVNVRSAKKPNKTIGDARHLTTQLRMRTSFTGAAIHNTSLQILYKGVLCTSVIKFKEHPTFEF
jgi:hypothetical protein